MHLLAAQSGEAQQEGEAIDLGQSPADIIFVSFADSELAALAGAVDRAKNSDIRLANILTLSHNFSIDLWLENTVQHAKLVVVRLLGGVSYWQFGVDELSALALKKNIKLAFLPGDANIDISLLERSNIPAKEWHFLHSLFTIGSPQNMDLALSSFRALAFGEELGAVEVKPFARFGVWLPEVGIVDGLEGEFVAILRQAQDEDGVKVQDEMGVKVQDEMGVKVQDEMGVEAQDADPHPELVEGRGAEWETQTKQKYIPIIFYRAILEGAGSAIIESLIAELKTAGFIPIPIFISSLKESENIEFVKSIFKEYLPEVILNLTGFALGIDGIEKQKNPFANIDAPIIQLVSSGRQKEEWEDNIQGLNAKDLAMQIVLPEMDGRIACLLIGHKKKSLWHERTQCQLSAYAPYEKGIKQAVELTKNWSELRQTNRVERRVVMVLANYPVREGRIANGVGYDAPQSSVEIMKALEKAGYDLDRNLPKNGNELIKFLQTGPTNANPKRGKSEAILSLKTYQKLFSKLPNKIQNEVNGRWGKPTNDPFYQKEGFHLPVKIFGNIAILLQPARGYDRDIDANYHDPDLVPPHAYIAAYLWVKYIFKTHALIHNGKHGNLEWLPGKATVLDEASYPLALWGALPHFYPFIVNDPGEGTQAKRRTGAVIIDHLVPPLTRAETYGVLKDLEALLDEYYAASGMDRRRLAHLKKRILDFTRDASLDKDIGLSRDDNAALGEIDNYLCELKEAQIRDGLHIFGNSPTGELERDLIVALARVPRGEAMADASIIRALADDFKLGFNPLSAKLGEKWNAPKPKILLDLSKDIWRTNGDTVERLEIFAQRLVMGEKLPKDFINTKAVLATIENIIRPKLASCGANEIKSLIDGLDGKFIAPGSSGAPSRGRLDVLPTGRNFYSLDTRSVPTQTAWELGKKSAENMIERHFQDNGTYLKSIALSVWGTANMRTGGDDIAQALALIGAKPKWDFSSLRISGYEIIPLAKLTRPRVDVTLRISGFFRDAFPQLIVLFDKAVRAIGALDEPVDENPIAQKMRQDALELMTNGANKEAAALSAGHRIFGSKPGAYGAGLQGLIDNSEWENKGDLSRAFINFSQYAYGAKAKGIAEKERFVALLGNVEAVVHNQDNREHDLLDSDDYYQFEGGLVASVETIKGEKPFAYNNDHSRPDRPITRTLEEEISYVMRSRVVNPKWIAGVKRHGYKGAFEIIASVDYMFAFAATTGAVKSHHFDLAFEAFIIDENVRDFIKQNNSHGYDELKYKFNEAIKRGFWQPKSNSVYQYL